MKQQISINYNIELAQVAAVALAALQQRETGTTSLVDTSLDDWVQQFAKRVFTERLRQEQKYGTRTTRDMGPRDWMTILIREVGEVAEEI